MATTRPATDTIVGVFDNIQFAHDAVNELAQSRFSDNQIGLLAPHEERPDHESGTANPTESRASNVAAGAAAGVTAGATVGAMWAVGIAAGLLPAIGPVIAGGLLASVLASAAGGAAVAGVIGALVGLGIPEEEARFYEGELQAGRTLVTVRTEGRIAEAATILRRHGAYDVQTKETYQSTDEYRRKSAEVSTVDYPMSNLNRPR